MPCNKPKEPINQLSSWESSQRLAAFTADNICLGSCATLLGHPQDEHREVLTWCASSTTFALVDSLQRSCRFGDAVQFSEVALSYFLCLVSSPPLSQTVLDFPGSLQRLYYLVLQLWYIIWYKVKLVLNEGWPETMVRTFFDKWIPNNYNSYASSPGNELRFR